jgi:dihydrofolate synthase / folylpolyglutamate synthase
MAQIRSLAEAEAVLADYIPAVNKFTGKDITLQRMQPLMERLGNPQDRLKIIHVAGTSGKTSTAYYIASMLTASGKKVGLTISPHAYSITERFQINMRLISEKAFCKNLELFLKKIEGVSPKPSYFELLIAFAYWHFAKSKVDYAVIETGMGGLHDSTNVANKPNKVCVITDIGLDHMEFLGLTLSRIAAQKAGIIRPHNTVFSYEQNEQIMQVIREVCEQQQAELHEVWSLKAGDLPKNLPLFQRRNWYLAWSVFAWLRESDQLPGLTEQQLAQTSQTYIPARMEEIEIGGKIVILDGSHNAQKLHALVASIKKKYPKQKAAVLTGFIKTKQASLHEDLRELLPIASHLSATGFSTGGMPKDSMAPLKIVEHLDALGFENWEIAESPEKAFKKLLKRKEQIILVTGSFYLLNHIRPLIMSRK